jgi:bifunctional DNase/RNase
MPVAMELSRILIREDSDLQLIELTEVGGDRTFPISIGLPEAIAIDRRLKGMPVPRPQTHELLAAVIRALGGTLRAIHVRELRGSTFYASLVIEQGGRLVGVDSRPSDAIALGVADGVPVLVEEDVLAAVAADAPGAVEPGAGDAVAGEGSDDADDAGDAGEEAGGEKDGGE